MSKEFYCPDCGGTNLTVDAQCNWDVVEQEFVLDSFLDGYDFCNDCAEQVNGDWREVTDVKTLAKLAIHNADVIVKGDI